MKSVLIVGYGTVGKNLHRELMRLNPDIVDKYKTEIPTSVSKKYDFAFICVDTPTNKSNICDITEVKNAILENDADIYIIKSTILPGTTGMLIKEIEQLDGFSKRIIFSPEYYGGTQHCNNYRFHFTILGGDRVACRQVIQLLQNVYDGRHEFRITDSKTAELTKYMENAYLATKVSFCVQFWEIAKTLGIAYEELRELFVLDPRINPSHTFVYDDKPYWNSHCLNKDVPAIADFASADFLQDVIKYNNYCQQKYKK